MPVTHSTSTTFRLALGLALVVATWTALTPHPLPIPDAPHADKWAHLATYVLLALLVDASWPKRAFDLPKWLFLIGYGITIELIQSQIPNRMFSLADIGANATGIALYAFFILRILRTRGLR